MQGKRIADGELPLEPGEYSKHIVQHTDKKNYTCWMMTAPNGNGPFMIGPKPPRGGHEVEENGDGTITVRPRPNNSNSILVYASGKKEAWHGYIYNGVWQSV